MEGPSITLFTEEATPFVGKRIVSASGSAKLLEERTLSGERLKALRSWGKHLILVIGESVIRIHFLMFGSYRINAPKAEREPRLELQFINGGVYFYTCAVTLLEQPLDELYDWRVDLMSPEWSSRRVSSLLRGREHELVADLILDQDVFAGAGNIIKNEVLFRLKMSPRTKLGDLNARQRQKLVREVHEYSHLFYTWKKAFELRKHWLIYKKKRCVRCGGPIKIVKVGKLKRRTFWCPNCQT
ncbi:MAG: zinc finger domain-containing protein [Bdellovibrionota bacterium]